VDQGAFVYLEDPNPEWANEADCNEWACTGPNNVVLAFSDTQYGGYLQGQPLPGYFSIVGSVSTAIDAYENC